MNPILKKSLRKKPALKIGVERGAKKSVPKRDRAMRAVDALLDEALDETFPASDPVALTQPSRRRRAELRPRARATA
jgi:hypothetical protein